MEEGFKMKTALTVPEECKIDIDELYKFIDECCDTIMWQNVQNYIDLYHVLNEQCPINLHQFCKFLPAEYRHSIKKIVLDQEE